jgi:hypothetical protein
VALAWLWCGFGVALVWLWCGCGVATVGFKSNFVQRSNGFGGTLRSFVHFAQASQQLTIGNVAALHTTQAMSMFALPFKQWIAVTANGTEVAGVFTHVTCLCGRGSCLFRTHFQYFSTKRDNFCTKVSRSRVTFCS